MRYKNTFLSFFIVLIVWQLATLRVNEVLFPGPLNVLYSFFESKNLVNDVVVSLVRLVVGSFIGVCLGITAGLFTGMVKSANESLGSVANFFRFIPPLALVPLFLVWFGIGEVSKIGLLAWTAFFPVWISTHNGVKNIEKNYLLVAKSLCVKRIFMIKEIVLKGAMPYILSGARIGVGIAFSVLIAAEMLGAYAGVGYRIFFLQSVYRVDRMLGYIIVLGIIGLFIDKLFLIMSKKLIPWKDES